MDSEEILDAYYFAIEKEEEMEPLFEEFSMLFSKIKMVPLNFQLRMSEAADQSRTSKKLSDKGDRLSVQSAAVKIDLRRMTMTRVLNNRSSHPVFSKIVDNDEQELDTWLWIDNNEVLQGAVNCAVMQKLFEEGTIDAYTQVKQKMSSEFTLACHLLNKYCRKFLIGKFEEKEQSEALIKESRQFLGSSLSQANPDLEKWLSVIGKRPEFGRKSFTTSREGEKNQMRKQCVSISFKSPELNDKGSVKDDVFDRLVQHKKTVEDINKIKSPNKKRQSMAIPRESSGQDLKTKEQGKFRKRMSTTATTNVNPRGRQFKKA